MQIPVEIYFRGVDRSLAAEARIHEWVGKLERISDRITRCEVVVETPHKHQRRGRQFHVGIRLTIPGGELVTSRDPGTDDAHEDLYVAIRDAFQVARRQLDEYAAKIRHDAANGLHALPV